MFQEADNADDANENYLDREILPEFDPKLD